MKRHFTLLCLLYLCVFTAVAQQGINYQAIVRDAAGEPIINETATVIFRIGQSGSTIYQESHSVTTNQFGLVNLVIGEGNPSTGVFGDINWGSAPVSVTVAINGATISTQEFKSVPYAMHCATADAVTGGGSTITASNGLVRTGDDIRLGGSLSSNTDIDLNGNDIAFENNITFEVRDGAFWLRNMTDNRDVFYADMNNYAIRIGSTLRNVSLTYIDGNQGLNKVLTSDALGNARWQTPAASPWTVSGENVYRATGNVGIGTTTPVNKLDVEGGVAIGASYSGTSVAPTNGLIVEGRVGIGAVTPLYPLHIQTASNTPFTINMTSNGAFSASTGYNRIRMENGTSTQHWLLSSHAQIGAESTNNANFNIFYSGLGNIASFRGDGSVGIGIDVPTTGTRLHVQSNASTGYVARFYNTNTDVGSDGIVIGVGGATPSTGANYILFTRAGASSFPTGSITSTGANGVAYNATSDRRLKQNIVDIENALGVINKIQPRTYQFKVNPTMSQDGFIAQEMAEVYPWVVSGNPEGDVLTDPMMIDYSKLTPLLTKAIQEQQQLIEENQKQIKLLQEELNALKRQ